MPHTPRCGRFSQRSTGEGVWRAGERARLSLLRGLLLSMAGGTRRLKRQAGPTDEQAELTARVPEDMGRTLGALRRLLAAQIPFALERLLNCTQLVRTMLWRVCVCVFCVCVRVWEGRAGGDTPLIPNKLLS